MVSGEIFRIYCRAFLTSVVSSPVTSPPSGPPHLSDPLQALWAIIPFDWRFSCADRGVLPAMIPLILPRLPDYQDFGVPTSAFLIIPRLPFNHHDFDVRGPRSMCKRDVSRWINAPRCRRKVSTSGKTSFPNPTLIRSRIIISHSMLNFC